MGVTPGGVTLGTAEKGANFPEVENQRAKNSPKGKNEKRTKTDDAEPCSWGRKRHQQIGRRFLRPGGHRGGRRSLTSSGKRATQHIQKWGTGKTSRRPAGPPGGPPDLSEQKKQKNAQTHEGIVPLRGALAHRCTTPFASSDKTPGGCAITSFHAAPGATSTIRRRMIKDGLVP